MGKAIPFSDVDLFLNNLAGAKGCIVDSNFLIALSEENHPFNDDAKFLYEKLVDHEIRIYCTVTNRTEFIDFHRKMIMTETLMSMLSPTSKWKISATTKKDLLSHKGWIDNQAKDDQLPLLTDHRLKECKKSFLPKTQSGQVGWVALCQEYLSGNLLNAWEVLAESLQLNYIDMRSGESQKYFEKELLWEKMYAISEDTCLGSSDSMLMNVLNSSIFPFIVSADYDLAYGVLQNSTNKSILVPDNLYRRYLKGLRF